MRTVDGRDREPGERLDFYAVYDGHGGRDSAEFVGAYLHEGIAEILRAVSEGRTHKPSGILQRVRSR